MLVWQAAEHNANVLRKALGQKGRIDLDAVCAMLDIEVRYRYDLPGGASGMIIKRENRDKARIYINAGKAEKRQRFTLAHEIGHYIERMVQASDREFSFTDGIERRTTQKYDLHEFYANQFAGALLMPENEVRLATPNLDDPLTLSLHFDVSIPAAQKRLERLSELATIGAPRFLHRARGAQ